METNDNDRTIKKVRGKCHITHSVEQKDNNHNFPSEIKIKSMK